VNRVLLDTWFIQALLGRRDKYHEQAKKLFTSLLKGREVWVTEAVLVEVGNALSAYDRAAAVEFIKSCYRTKNIQVVTVDTELLMRATDLYHQRRDKEWGLTDCISFVVMRDNRLTDALTGDHHFEQAGFQILMPS